MIKLFASGSKTSIPPRNRNWYGHVDGGGTFTRVTIADKRNDKQVYHRTFVSSEYNSVDDIVVEAFREAGGVPEKAVFALAGPCDLENGKVKFTNRDNWPEFTLHGIRTRTGVEGKLHNDVELLAADAANTADHHTTVIKPGHIWPGGRVVVLTHSTGINPAVSEHGRTFATEMGNIGLVPVTDDERSYAEFVARSMKRTYATAEPLLGGAYGFRHAASWLEHLGVRPDPETYSMMRELVEQKKGVGPAITSRVGKDPFCDRIIYTLGGFYGTYLRELLVSLQPTGGLHLVGGVNFAAAEIFADPKNSPLIERVNDPHLPFHERVQSFAIVLNRDVSLISRGAKVLADRL